MKVIAVLQADLQVTPIGTRSRLGEELGGIPILRRTVERVRRAKNLAGVYVLCPTSQLPRCTTILEGTGAIVRAHDAGPSPYGSLIQSARKWSLDGWRGGIGGTTAFDEYTDCRLIDGLLKSIRADAVLSVPAAAVVFDPALADQTIDHRRALKDDSRLTFAQTPPGLTGILLDTALIGELVTRNIPIGWLFSYQPDGPRKDLIFEPCCLETAAPLRFAAGRMIADTDRAMRTLAELLRQHPDPDSLTVGQWLIERDADFVEPLPHEVEIELTTDDPYPDQVLRPRGDRVPRRGPIELSVIQRVVTEIVRYDDALVVLGGFGDPLRHPQFRAVLDLLRPSRPPNDGVYGLCVRTAAADLHDEQIAAIVDHGVDVLNVALDAWSPDLYGRLHAPHDPASACLERVLAGMDRLSKAREQCASARPIVVPEMSKARENVRELDDFYDGWLRRVGAVSVTGFSHYARQCEDRSVIKMAPSARTPCRRIQLRCLVLADGRVALCDQDFRGLHTVGRVGERSLEDIWRGAESERIRLAHRRGQFDPTPLCAACDEWHRP